VSVRTESESLPFAAAGAATRVGSTHLENQDCYQVLDGRTSTRVREMRRGLLYAVADGVSTLEQGRWAAETTCARLGQFFEDGHASGLDTLVQLVGEIDWELRGQGKGKAACTLGALWLHGGSAHVLHVGDSPVFRLRDGVVECLTQLDPPSRRLRAFMGMGPHISEVLRVRSEPFRAKDVYFLVTDGVSGILDTRVLARQWRDSGQDAGRCASGIMREVERRRGADDATAVVVQVLLEEDLEEERTEVIRDPRFVGTPRDTGGFVVEDGEE
jgi:eukaryotic-like serine/threonine-protein kinase